MIGWAAVTGDVSLVSLALFAIIFMWTPPHFWALSLYRSEDYARAGVPMMPVVSGRRETQRQILLYSVLLVPVTLTPWWLGAAGFVYAVGAAVLGIGFVGLALRVLVDRDDGGQDRAAKHLFAYSILYLFLVFALLVADRAAMQAFAS
jgi:protoheme IX farnesyltransferase